MLRILAIMLAMLPVSADAAEARSWCPGDEFPYTFTMFEDVLMINRMNHRAFCQLIEGDEYECVEKYLGDPEPSVYNVKAKLDGGGDLKFTFPDGETTTVKKCGAE